MKIKFNVYTIFFFSVFAGMTPLIVAASKNDIASAKILLDWGCDMYSKGRIMRRNYDFYRDAFELAIELKFPEFACLLAGCGYNISQVDYLVNWEMEPPQVLKSHPETLEYLRLNAVLPPSLFRWAIICIRKALECNIFEKAKLLPLPKFLIESVQLRDILEDTKIRSLP